MLLFNYINPAYYAIAWTVIHAIWQISLIVLLTAGLQALLRNTPARIRYFIWVGALFLVLASSLTTFIYYYLMDPAQLLLEQAGDGNVPTEVMVQDMGTSVAQSSPGPLSIASAVTYVNDNILVIVMIWLVGMMLAFIRLLGNIGYVEYLKNKFNFPVDGYWEELLQSTIYKMGIRKKVTLLESALVMSPMVIGHLKPVIFFPMGAINRLSPEEVEAILAHELAHIMRNDYLINLVVSCVESLYYFHPAMWWLTSQIKTEREHCCDDLAIEATGRPLQYAQSLVAVQEMAFTSPRLAMQFAGKEKKSRFFLRVNRLIKPNTHSTNLRERSLAAVITALLVIVVAMSSKPIDNAAHCLPVNAGNEKFLKFDGAKGIDSLALDFAINDGVYHYNDHYYHAEMEIENRRVVSLILNGLKISGNDIKRFSNLVREILLADQRQKPGENITSHSFYDTFAEQLTTDKLLTKVTVNKVLFNKAGLVINGNKQSKEVYNRYRSLYSNLKTKDMPSDPDIKIDIYPDNDGTVIQADLIGTESEVLTKDKAKAVSKPNQSQVGTDINNLSEADALFNDWLDKQLIADGYIDDAEEFNYVWTRSVFLVDGEEVDEADVQRYKAKYEKMAGKPMDLNFVRTKNVTRD